MALAVAPRLTRAERLSLEAEPPPPPPDDTEPVSGVLEWALRHRRLEGRPFDLERFRPLRALYEETHPHVVVMKPSQRGVSEWAINLALFALDQGTRAWGVDKDGLNVGYLFPTQQALGDFSKERVSGLKREGDYLHALLAGGDFDAVTFKQVRQSYLYLRGAASEEGLLSFSADLLVLDEYDRINPKAAALARRRLGASLLRREVDISTPTVPGTGIHALYLQSDRREYEQSCPRCGAWQVYDFFRDVRADGEPSDTWRTWTAERLRRAEIRLSCPACREPLTDLERCLDGRWAAREPGVAGLRGYHIPALAFPFVSLEALAVAAVSQVPSEQEEFWRSDLGLPYDAGGNRVTAAMLARLSAHLPGGLLPDGPWTRTTMGVDVGARYHYRISSRGPGDAVYVREVGSVASWQELDLLLSAYDVDRCVVDALPELHGAAAWAARHPGRVLRAFYPTTAALAGQLYRADEDLGVVQVNRTMAMDRVWATLSAGREHWPASAHMDPEVVTHLTAPVRVTRQDQRGQEQATWVHTAPDHLYHACVYDQVAAELVAGATIDVRLI